MKKDDFVGAEVCDEEEGLDEESDTAAGRDLCSYISNKLRFFNPDENISTKLNSISNVSRERFILSVNGPK